MNKDDELLFADEMIETGGNDGDPWKILIADDEEEVHAVTRMVLENFTFEGKGVELLSTYSGYQTKQFLRQYPDIAVLLLDVVMEEDTTGLEVVRYIREELRNNFVRIILRTGQPGQAPEQKVTMEYDINDYKEKTELTAQKLFTTVIGLLRAYRDLRMIEKSRKGLEEIATISASLFQPQPLKSFALELLVNLSALLHCHEKHDSPLHSGFAISRQAEEYYILAGIGRFEGYGGQLARKVIPQKLFQQLMQAIDEQRSFVSLESYIGYFPTQNGSEHLIYIDCQTTLNGIEQELIRVLEVNAAVAFENIDLNRAIIETQREVLFTLGEVVETRCRQTKEHTKKIAAYSHLLALKVGLNEDEANTLRLASPLHDVGTLGIPDAILHKEDSLTAEESEVFKKHPIIGRKILQGAKQPILKIAAQLALQHHEYWDGQGFPYGLKGKDIHLFARILRIADAFDEFTLARRHPGMSERKQVEEFFKNERGAQFDPTLVDAFLKDLDEFLAI